MVLLVFLALTLGAHGVKQANVKGVGVHISWANEGLTDDELTQRLETYGGREELDEVVALDLSGNPGVTTLAKVCTYFRRLRDLRSSRCSLVAMERELLNCDLLTRVDLSHNKLSEFPREALHNNRRLSIVDLSHNPIGSIPKQLPIVLQLSELRMEGANLEGGLPESLERFNNMHTLRLADNRISFVPLSLARLMNNLTTLDLRRNPPLKRVPADFSPSVLLTDKDVAFDMGSRELEELRGALDVRAYMEELMERPHGDAIAAHLVLEGELTAKQGNVTAQLLLERYLQNEDLTVDAPFTPHDVGSLFPHNQERMMLVMRLLVMRLSLPKARSFYDASLAQFLATGSGSSYSQNHDEELALFWSRYNNLVELSTGEEDDLADMWERACTWAIKKGYLSTMEALLTADDSLSDKQRAAVATHLLNKAVDDRDAEREQWLVETIVKRGALTLDETLSIRFVPMVWYVQEIGQNGPPDEEFDKLCDYLDVTVIEPLTRLPILNDERRYMMHRRMLTKLVESGDHRVIKVNILRSQHYKVFSEEEYAAFESGAAPFRAKLDEIMAENPDLSREDAIAKYQVWMRSYLKREKLATLEPLLFPNDNAKTAHGIDNDQAEVEPEAHEDL